MNQLKRKLKKEDFSRVFNLYPKQPWLCDKENSLIELILLCESTAQKDLIIDLLGDFKYLDQKVLNSYLNFISDCIINDSGFEEEKTMIASLTIDDDADSSQKVLDYLKTPLFKMGWSTAKTVNRFNSIPKTFKQGRNQIILIDEFIGSGKTALGRIRHLNEWIKSEYDLKFCFLVGMDYGISKIEEMGFEVFCPLRLPQGIDERYSREKVSDAIEKMRELENKLAQNVNSFELSTYSMGYNNAQALYSLESCLGNTPNSVFPIFWWPQNLNSSKRNTLLTRVESGLQ
ncbi:MAG: hypothetical protein LAT81_13795 [Oceanicaulis sp.]|nr:hypothetical protein [Oceanicaulis sp.]